GAGHGDGGWGPGAQRDLARHPGPGASGTGDRLVEGRAGEEPPQAARFEAVELRQLPDPARVDVAAALLARHDEDVVIRSEQRFGAHARHAGLVVEGAGVVRG